MSAEINKTVKKGKQSKEPKEMVSVIELSDSMTLLVKKTTTSNDLTIATGVIVQMYIMAMLQEGKINIKDFKKTLCKFVDNIHESIKEQCKENKK